MSGIYSNWQRIKKQMAKFDIKSDEYARSRPRYPSNYYEYSTTLVNNRDKLWDCACGNGQVSIDLVDYFEKIFATDISENQINNAFKHPKISYSAAPTANKSKLDEELN
jgi:tRNA/tmRNA/rRNA uracil-C5-methylase (TrmA/RlmC/RlmD family)